MHSPIQDLEVGATQFCPSQVAPSGQMTVCSTLDTSAKCVSVTLAMDTAAVCCRYSPWVSISMLDDSRPTSDLTSTTSSYTGGYSVRVRSGHTPWKQSTHRVASQNRITWDRGIADAYTIANTRNMSPGASVVYRWWIVMMANGYVAAWHAESCVRLHLAVVSSGQSVHGRHCERFPGEYVPMAHSRTSGPPRHSYPGAHGEHALMSDCVPAPHRRHSPLTSMNPSTHVQLSASTHSDFPPSHSESGRHCLHMAAPWAANMSAGHDSWCAFPRQYSPAGHAAHRPPSTNTVPAAHGAHTPPAIFTHPRSHTHSSSDDAPTDRVCENATHGTHAPFCEYVSTAHCRSCDPLHSYPAGHARHESTMNHDPTAHPSHPYWWGLSQKQSPSHPDPRELVV